MEFGELSGYLASLLVFAAFYMRDMFLLRVVAIASNLAFIAYAWVDHLPPILILHSVLLPLNVLRLLELRTANVEAQKTSNGSFSAGDASNTAETIDESEIYYEVPPRL